MAEEIIIAGNTKAEKWEVLIPQVVSLIENDDDPISRMANVAAAIHSTFNFLWTGFYRVRRLPSDPADGILVLGPFQGPSACTRIRHGRGVCGTAWAEARTVIVDNVDDFPGHIACSSLSRSEIVVPVFDADGAVAAVIDIDSAELATFDSVDAEALERIAAAMFDSLIASQSHTP